MKKSFLKITLIMGMSSFLFLSSCNKDDGEVEVTEEETTDTGSTLHKAFAEFSENVSVSLSDDGDVTIESNGFPNHTSPYWSNTTFRSTTDPMGNELSTVSSSNHELWVEPTETSNEAMAPGNIDDFDGTYTLTVSANPEKAATSSATGLGAIGIAVSGSMIYNDEEGENVALDDAIVSLDYTGAHTGPQSYHYHLETNAWSNDDSALIGIMSDGFFLYGRRDSETGEYPTDLDESGGHFGPTQHNADGEYHYHIQNDLYLGKYILFPDDLQGTPSTIQ